MSESNCPSCHQPLPADAPAGLCPTCVLAAALESAPVIDGPSLEELSAAFPQLEILEYIGRGAMGIVYKARQPHLDRLVALKILAPDLSSDPAFEERFSREAKTLAKLSHPNIVGIHDFGESGGFFYLLMEFVDGVNLRQAMRASRFTAAQALTLVPKLCSAIQFAHDHGILHRDIKPENILLDTAGRVKIADFGIARLIGDEPALQLTATGSALGSAAYMAPEQIEDPRNVDHRADIYSLGVVFYEMLTGGLPLGRFPAPSESGDSDPGIDAIVMRALEKHRERRYQRADEIETDLGQGAQASRLCRPTDRPSHASTTSNSVFRWSLGLLFGGLITGTIGQLTSPVILGLGVIAFIFGQIGCWWMLIRMKQGKFPSDRRKLLLIVSFLPALIAVVWLVVIAPLCVDPTDLHFDDSGFENIIYSEQIMPLLWVIAPFILAVLAGRFLWKLVALPPTTEPTPGFLRFQQAAAFLAPLLLIGSLVAAKHLKEQLHLFNKYAATSFTIRNAGTYTVLNDEDASFVKQAALEAAGDHMDFYRIEFPPAFQQEKPDSMQLPSNQLHPGTMGVDFICDVLWKDDRAKEHFDAYHQRLRALLPDRFMIGTGHPGIHRREIEHDSRMTRGIFGMLFTITLGASAFLVVFASNRAFVVCLATGLVATVVLSNLSNWPAPAVLPPAKPYRDPLPELAPIIDRSTPRATIESLIRAARREDIEAFSNCFSTSRSNFVPNLIDPNALKINASIEILKVKQVDPFNATVAARAKTPKGLETVTIHLQLENEDWLIVALDSSH
ncbi:serine/threonine-protein kinase [Haloferula chungangensis]|uniref:Serine/threonine-protein kinase n=1 Tax=Haloferula chungangensis TaxID=1048331 RepID=A0ABW2L5K8_9BACT